MTQPVVTRFAPSPTGALHLGSCRTALFNWLYAKSRGGRFLLRIEDTDRERSQSCHEQSIFQALKWMNLTWDGDVMYQKDRQAVHQNFAHTLYNQGLAYGCRCTDEVLAHNKAQAQAEKRPFMYDGRCRDKNYPLQAGTALRLKVEALGTTTFQDMLRSDPLRVQNTTLEDMVLLRRDGTPTYMLAVVIDDHDMGVTHVIRGDDHLTNTYKQTLLYQALGWNVPQFCHIPLIHDLQGKKLSKRQGAQDVLHYRDAGFLPQAVENTLLRLGWSHGDDEIIPRDQAIEWFDTRGLGKSAARFNPDKLLFLNKYYMKHLSLEDVKRVLLWSNQDKSRADWAKIQTIWPDLVTRVTTIPEASDMLRAYAWEETTWPMTAEDLGALTPDIIQKLYTILARLPRWHAVDLEAAIRAFVAAEHIAFKDVAGPLRRIMTGQKHAPGLFLVLEVLGQPWVISRLAKGAQLFYHKEKRAE